jgi:Transcriptional regulators containing a DNA-binding HTH domain and an aminotransferase domain (MocR family) and their eukaryotic orthologs
MVSAGEVHLPGRPKDVVGVKALAITAQRAFEAFRPGGVKVHAGAPVIEKGMVEEDFKELAAAGVRLLGEVGLGGVKTGEEAKRMVAWARKYGIQSTIHTGGPPFPARASSTRMWCWRPMRMSSAISTAAIPLCPGSDPLPLRAMQARHRDRP